MEPPERGGRRETPRTASGKLPRAPTVVASGALKAKEETKSPVAWGNFLNQTLVMEGGLPSAFPKAGVGPTALRLWVCSIRGYGPVHLAAAGLLALLGALCQQVALSSHPRSQLSSPSTC